MYSFICYDIICSKMCIFVILCVVHYKYKSHFHASYEYNSNNVVSLKA